MTRILRRIVHNWPLKLAAVGLATLMYSGLALSQNTQTYGNRVPVQYINGPSNAVVLPRIPDPITQVRYFAPTRSQVLDLRLAMPELGASIVAAGSYPSLRTHYATVGLYNFAVAHKDLPDDLVYAIVDAAFANQELLIEAHPAAAETTPANLSRNSFLPFHGGAARWYHLLA